MASFRFFAIIALVICSLISIINAEDRVCNGNAAYCSRSYSNITFIGSHDSPFVGDEPSDNQDISLTDQLNKGIRYLQGQTHKNVFGDLDLCHTNCLLLDAGKLESYLGTVKSWLDGNPNEVVTLLLTNGDSLDVSEFGTAFNNAGVDSYAYVPDSEPLSIDSWPTIGDMIDSGKRLVVFLDYHADTSKVNYILDEFAYYFETPFDVTDSSSFSSCNIDRPSGASADGRMYIVNHFLDMDVLGIDVPDRDAAGTTNAADGDGSIGTQASVCEGLYGRNPNVILLDWTGTGEGIDAQTSLNGL